MLMLLLLSYVPRAVLVQLAQGLLLACALAAVTLATLVMAVRLRQRRRVAFFHPYAECGGGGERVLFLAIRALQEIDPTTEILIYTGCQNLTGSEILADAQRKFNIGAYARPDRIRFVRLRLRFLVEAWMYPRLTMVGQSFGSVILALEALVRAPAQVFIDTTGFAFTYPLACISGCRVGCYTHYPTISTDMITLVQSGTATYNNASIVAKTALLRQVKVWYYRAFAYFYGMVGRTASVICVNSSWTRAHIDALWRVPRRTFTVFPPCDTTTLRKMPLLEGRQDIIISVGQFRPEKNHALQLRAFARFLRRRGEAKSDAKGGEGPRLRLIGGCRNAGDHQRVSEIKALAKKLGISDRVEVEVNVPFERLKQSLRQSKIGLHTMWNEHFGICVVELMAAGVIPVAHNSAGPRQDIVVEYQGKPTGFLATTEEEYAECLEAALCLSDPDSQAMRERARKKSGEFSNERFLERFKKHIKVLL
mmetsp:Transcript_30237/g.56482  ORF Transcript_30237/g.56482 Transcript_30237/m.56482 type:complete len:479 (-) Transcript_30237:74-1510(-)